MKRYQRYLLRPTVYLAATRLMLSGIVMLAIARFVPKGPSMSMIAAFLAVVFALGAYLIYLRMDGLRIPRMKYIRPKRKKDPLRNFGDMSDYADEDPGVSFEELEAEERDLCSFLSNVFNLAVFLALSFVL